MLQEQLTSINSKLEEANRTLGDFDTAKKKLAMENSDLLHEVCTNTLGGLRPDAEIEKGPTWGSHENPNPTAFRSGL